MLFGDFLDAVSVVFEFGFVVGTGTTSGVGKEGNPRLIPCKSLVGFGGIFDNTIKLVAVWMLDDAAVGNNNDAIVFLANKTAGEISRFERDLRFEGEKDVARRIIEAGDDRVGLAFF